MFRRRQPLPEAPAPLQRLAQGDALALDIVYRAEAGEVYRFALAMCGNPAWSADAVQDAFVHIAEDLSGFDAAKGPLRAYLCGIARHRLLARWRESRGGVAAEDEDIADEVGEAFALAPDAELARAQDSASLWGAIRALPWSFREAVVLVDLQERPYAEAAQIAGVELNTLRTRLHRGRQRLAQALAPQYGELQT